MLKTLSFTVNRIGQVLVFYLLLAVPQLAFSQGGITVYQYRHVPSDKVDEFIKRESTYWSEIAGKATEKGNLTFWALLEKVGGYDLPNSSNFLFINTYKDIDHVDAVWNSTAAFPNVSMDKMETNSMSTVTSMIFLSDQNWEQADGANPANFKYVTMIYHNTDAPDDLIALEKKHWAPFIKSAMNMKKTEQLAWGNATVLSPVGPDMGFSTVSYDLYSSLKEALTPTWVENTVFPEDGLAEIEKVEAGPRSSVVYRVVKAVSTEE